MALGPGGLPNHVGGWLAALVLKLCESNTLSTEMYDQDQDKTRWLDTTELPRRNGPRPDSGFHVAPVRQLDQLPSDEMGKVRGYKYGTNERVAHAFSCIRTAYRGDGQ